MSKSVLGHIDCPVCGTVKGMRITPDKNGEPFGYCEAECNAQLRVGGYERRVAAFVSRYPWAAGQPVTDNGTEPASKDQAPAKPVTETAPAPAKPARRPAANPFDFLLKGGQA